MNTVHRFVDEPGHRSCSRENDKRVGTNVSEVLGGQVGISALVLVTAPAAGSNFHRSSANSEHNSSGNILAQRVSSSRGCYAQEQREEEGKPGNFSP